MALITALATLLVYGTVNSMPAETIPLMVNHIPGTRVMTVDVQLFVGICFLLRFWELFSTVLKSTSWGTVIEDLGTHLTLSGAIDAPLMYSCLHKFV